MNPKLVHPTLKKHQLADGLPLVFDLEKSHGVWLHDSLSGADYLDAFTCFASWPIGYNHPRMADEQFLSELTLAAACNPTNSDLYTEQMARFVEAFATHVTPADYPHNFWVAGGALAVENALKTAFDWKARKLGHSSVRDSVNDLVILHFREAFHGRSGYTMSLTNTDPVKVGLFPKFDWPRVHNPKIEFDFDGSIIGDIEASEARACTEIEAAFSKYRNRIAGIIIEPIQGEGGDNHFRPEFLQRVRNYANEHEALLIYDEVQTGFFGSGSPWVWQQQGVAPDVVAFGKKTQVCGIYANRRVDEVKDNVFQMKSRINSTWGGNLVDMVRCRKFIEIILAEQLAEKVTALGQMVITGLREALRNRDGVSNVRGVGSLAAFTLPTPEARDKMIGDLLARRVLALKSGDRSIRFRLPFVMEQSHVDELIERVAACLPSRAR